MRKEPRQRRSRETVERIVAAGREVLLADGYAALSTNRVAEVAGVSPGSLYQYFTDKHEIVTAVIDSYWERIADEVAGALTGSAGLTGPDLVRASAAALVDTLERHVELVRVVTQELPPARSRERRRALQRRVADLLTAFLAADPVGRGQPDPAAAAWMLVVAIEHLSLAFVLDSPPLGRERFLDEMVALCSGYVVTRAELIADGQGTAVTAPPEPPRSRS